VLGDVLTVRKKKVDRSTEGDVEHCLSAIHQNVCSLLCKVDGIESLVFEEDPDYLVLTEHFLRAPEASSVKISSYQHVSSFSRSTFRGGGVIILGRDLSCTGEICIPEDICIDKDFEAAVCKISVSSKKWKDIFLVGIYRSPNGDFLSFIERLGLLLNFIGRPESAYVLMGDFNVDSINPSNRMTELSSVVSSFGLKLQINFPTRVYGSSVSAIDHVFTDIDPDCCNVTILNHAISDHYGQKISIFKLSDNNRDLVKKRNLTPNNLNALSFKLSLVDWGGIGVDRSLNEMITYFSKTIVNNLDIVCPLRYCRVKTRPRPDWLTRGLIVSGKKLKEMFFTYITTCDNEFKTYYRRYKRLYQKLIRVAKAGSFSKKMIESRNISKTAWKIINSVRRTKNNVQTAPLEINDNCNSVTDPSEIVNILNRRFVDVKGNLGLPHANQPVFHASVVGEELLDFPGVTEGEVETLLRNLKTSNSVGNDGIPSIVLKNCSGILAKPLSIIMNRSYSIGQFPESLKTARVVPIFKKGNRSDPDCYRPISILPTLSKLFERQAYTVLIGYVDKNKILADSQHGFRKNRSTTAAASDLVEYLIASLDGGRKVVGTFLDLSRAFDCVDHVVLLQMLENFGFKGKVLSWLESFVCNRHQFVQLSYPCATGIRIYNSKTERMVSGVPQGSVLGPLLFLLYVNNLSSFTPERVIQYADDTSLACTGDNMWDAEINNFIAANIISQEVFKLGLKLNEKKSTFLKFSLSRHAAPPLSLMINNTFIEESEGTNFLGIFLDRGLNWNLHVDKVCNEMSSGIFVLRRLAMYCNRTVLKNAYYALVHSRLRYGIVLWGASTIGNTERVLRMQKRALRCVAGLKNRDSCREYFRNLRVLTFPAIYVLETIRFALSKITSNDFIGAQNRCYITRSNGNCTLPLPRVRLEISEKKPSYAGIKLFNSLPAHLRMEVEDRKSFFKSLKQYLLNKCPYKINEFSLQEV
jgi:hypothetical protein